MNQADRITLCIRIVAEAADQHQRTGAGRASRVNRRNRHTNVIRLPPNGGRETCRPINKCKGLFYAVSDNSIRQNFASVSRCAPNTGLIAATVSFF